MPTQLYALERYGTGDVPLPPPDLPLTGSAHLVSLARLPDDDVELAMVEGPDPGTVSASMIAAGWRVDRVTVASWICPPPCPGTSAPEVFR